MIYWLVMPAAGAGRRFGGEVPKQHAPLAGSTVLELSLIPLLADRRCKGGVLVLAAADPRRVALRARLPAALMIVDGGAQRSESVRLGLASLSDRAANDDWVLVHDAVRPCLSAGDLERLLVAGADSAHGALLAVPVVETLKKQSQAGASAGTVQRAGLWRAQTPQMFRYGQLRHALQTAADAGREPTDEAQAIEWCGGEPLLVHAADSNVKITSGGDLQLAAAILALRGTGRVSP